MSMRLKSVLPRSLYGRALLILVVPIVTIQLVVSIAFIQRHFERVTQQMTGGISVELRLVLDRLAQGDEAAAQALAGGLGFGLADGTPPLHDVRRAPWDLSGRVVADTLRQEVPGFLGADLLVEEGRVVADFQLGPRVIRTSIDRRRMSATNPHQLLVLMIATSVLMTLISYLFLRNQIAPIKRLAQAAEAFGKGQHIPYKLRGATEVRAAGAAFLDMRARIERAIESRTLMLSGVSHDLRTPLTRLKLGLAMLPEDEETAALLADVADMERLVNEFLAFARGDATEDGELVDLAALLRRAVDNAERAGHSVELRGETALSMRLRPAAVTRAVENLLGNAWRFGTQARITLSSTERTARIVVEDDGPGIPMERRDEAVLPFARLDGARDPNRGGGVGLGLSITADIARSHGGVLRLGESEDLGGLKAELVLMR
ncbi:HAMP domain-containing protein [Gemmobacter fulvus]|uniref:histidine kinase n=1 Tax=Gemmobacter fulvus TaxID=2840474 RepID=A0A975S125_9RHOB|nr:ATP-binding protein [Gemmobacter fulvus]MBT9245496.1 HAMP domain-containing protein [Gemmobacter fulvus]QWK90202.1 HAMP domain-containing protein [Gemmobacter fulvus]